MKPLDARVCADLVLSERWLSKIQEADNGCVLWTAGRQSGYGRIRVDGWSYQAHRVALVASLGRDIADGMDVGHGCHDLAVAAGMCVGGVCDHRRCVNPDHLLEQTRRENSLSGDSIMVRHKAKTHCPYGHALAGDNLTPGFPGRKCLTCDRERSKRQHAAIAAAHKMLGITQAEYRRTYGSSRAVAEALIGAQR